MFIAYTHRSIGIEHGSKTLSVDCTHQLVDVKCGLSILSIDWTHRSSTGRTIARIIIKGMYTSYEACAHVTSKVGWWHAAIVKDSIAQILNVYILQVMLSNGMLHEPKLACTNVTCAHF